MVVTANVLMVHREIASIFHLHSKEWKQIIVAWTIWYCKAAEISPFSHLIRMDSVWVLSGPFGHDLMSAIAETIEHICRVFSEFFFLSLNYFFLAFHACACECRITDMCSTNAQSLVCVCVCVSEWVREREREMIAPMEKRLKRRLNWSVGHHKRVAFANCWSSFRVSVISELWTHHLPLHGFDLLIKKRTYIYPAHHGIQLSHSYTSTILQEQTKKTCVLAYTSR